MTKALVVILIGGVLFGFGLASSTMVQPEVVLSFLTFDDFGLALVMGAALVVCIPIYQLMPRALPKPPYGTSYDTRPRRVTSSTLIGGAVFGVGWGLCGVCPGAGVASLGVGNWPILFALAGILIGAYLQGVFASKPKRANDIRSE